LLVAIDVELLVVEWLVLLVDILEELLDDCVDDEDVWLLKVVEVVEWLDDEDLTDVE